MTSEFTPGHPLRAYASDGRWRDFSTDDFVGRNSNRFLGWKCAAGSRNLAIKPNGDVFVATCKEGGSLGNVYGEFKVPLEWRACTREHCPCGADLFIPKIKSDVSLLRKTLDLPTEMEKRTGDDFEVAAIERLHEATQKQIYWELTHRCNFDCSYCADYIHNKTDKFRPFAEIARGTEALLEKFADGARVNFIVSGGEPTLHPHFLDWVRMISVLGHHVSVHSNGSRTPDYFKKLIHYADLNLSLHFEFWNPEKFFRIVETVSAERLKQDGLKQIGHFEVKIMMPPGKYAEVLAVEDRLRAIPGFARFYTWSVVPLRVGRLLLTVDPAYSREESRLFGVRA